MDDFEKIKIKPHIFLEFSLSLVLDQTLCSLNHFKNLYQLLHQTERQLVASHHHVFDLWNFFCSVLVCFSLV